MEQEADALCVVLPLPGGYAASMWSLRGRVFTIETRKAGPRWMESPSTALRVLQESQVHFGFSWIGMVGVVIGVNIWALLLCMNRMHSIQDQLTLFAIAKTRPKNRTRHEVL